MSKKERTLSEWQSLVEQLADEPILNDVVKLQKRILEIGVEEGYCGERYPAPIVVKAGYHAVIEPWVRIKLEHLVFPDDVACAYELMSIEIGHVYTQAAPGALPLETFSIKTYAQQTPDKLIDVQKFNVPMVVPGSKIIFGFNPVDGAKNLPKIRGIAWCRVG